MLVDSFAHLSLEQGPARQFRTLCPVFHVVDKPVANVVGDPNAF
jgi:hypothetical protein